VHEIDVLSSRKIYESPWMRLREDRIVQNGTPMTFSVIDMREGVTVLPVYENGLVNLVSEYKYGIGRVSTEAISGGLDADENPLQAAGRELEEEVGLRAQQWTYLGRLDPFTTAVHSPNHLYLAQQLTVTAAHPDPGEVLTPVKLTFAEALEMVMNGTITHSATCVVILKVARILHPT
jgi:8-oxo-dGTP pyrophosphatase MutT (NUDIX family)